MLKCLLLMMIALSLACGGPGMDRKKPADKRQNDASVDDRMVETATESETETETMTSTSTATATDTTATGMTAANESAASEKAHPATATAATSSTSTTVGEPTIKPERLDLPGLRHASLREYAVEARCDGIKDALTILVAQHADGVLFEHKRCNRIYVLEDVIYRTEFDLVQSGRRKSYELSISKLYESKLEYRLSLVDGSSTLSLVDDPELYDQKLAKLAPALGHLHATLAAFVGKPTLEQTIFGHTYREFIAQLTSLAPAGGIRMKRGDKRLPIKLELLPDDGSEGRYGKVRFIDVPSDLLNAERGPLTSPGFFGCTTIECLNEGLKATFEFEENSLRINRPTSESTWQFASWTFADFPTMPEE